MQLKYSFKKEWAQFSRTFRLLGVILVMVGIALGNPLMFKFVAVVMDSVDFSGLSTSSASVALQTAQSGSGGINDIFGSVDMEEALAMYSDAGMMFSVSIASFTSMGLLVVMLILMSASGGEQKKRAMIVPMCSGLEYKNYLIPKFVIYPLVTFAAAFLSTFIAGGLCNAMFRNNKVAAGGMMLSALSISVYMVFVICVFMSIGLCTSHPGVLVPCVYIGQTLIGGLLNGMGLTRFHPFALQSYVSSGFITSSGHDFSQEIPSFITAIAISLVISVLMYFLALGVLKAKKINNQEEVPPEF